MSGWLSGFPVHVPEPKPDTAYTMEGRNAGRLLDKRYDEHYPAEAHCAGCGQMIRRESMGDPWLHTGRKPGEPGTVTP